MVAPLGSLSQSCHNQRIGADMSEAKTVEWDVRGKCPAAASSKKRKTQPAAKAARCERDRVGLGVNGTTSSSTRRNTAA